MTKSVAGSRSRKKRKATDVVGDFLTGAERAAVDRITALRAELAALLEDGASAVYACCSHPVLSGPAIENISKSCIKEVIVTNTIPLNEDGKAEPKIKVLSIAGLIGRAIQSIHEETSVSKLFL